MNPARVAALRLGMGEAMVAFTVQINCGSGMQSIDTAYRYIREGHSNLILAGGSEALSYAPLGLATAGVRGIRRPCRRLSLASAPKIMAEQRRVPLTSSRSSAWSAG